jgi:hypothetical protein
VPFHKLTGWTAYSLLEPLQAVLGWKVEGTEDMTGLPEYRNGEILAASHQRRLTILSCNVNVFLQAGCFSIWACSLSNMGRFLRSFGPMEGRNRVQSRVCRRVIHS